MDRKAAGKKAQAVNTPDGARYVTVREAAERVRSSEPSIRRMLAKQQLTRYKFVGKTLISIAELDSLVRAS
jgi:excisionase family DNA binding protein